MEKDTLLDEALSMLCVFGMNVSVGTVRWCGGNKYCEGEKHPSGLTGACGSNVQSIEGNLQEQGGGHRAECILNSKSQINCRSWRLGP